MPKLKTHKGAASRFRLTGSGKLVRMYGNRNHMRRKKRPEVLRKYRRTHPVAPGQAKKIRRVLAV